MPAHYNFCVRIGPQFTAPRSVAILIIEFFARTIGEPREVMRLDYESKEDTVATWKESVRDLDLSLKETEQIFIYMSLDPSFRGERSSVHVSHSNGVWVFCASLTNRDWASLGNDSPLAEIGTTLYQRICLMSNAPLLVAGGEELDVDADSRSLLEAVKKIVLDEPRADFAIYSGGSDSDYDSKRYKQERLGNFQVVKRHAAFV